MSKFPALAALGSAFLLGGCVSFGAEPPESLLTLTPTATAPAGVGAQGSQATALTLIEFDVPQSIDVTRLPVQISDTEIAYLQEAVWVERPARLFRRLIAETIRTRSNRVVIDGDDPGIGANDRLQGTLRQFGYDARTREVVVMFDAVRNREGPSVTTRRFVARAPVAEPTVDFVGPALNAAANEVAGQIAEWVG